MEIFIDKENRQVQMHFTGKASKLLKDLGINPETALVVRDNALVTGDEKLSDNDSIRILSVISGG